MLGRKREADSVAQRQTEPTGPELHHPGAPGEIKIDVENGDRQIGHRLGRFLSGEAAAHQDTNDLGDVGGADSRSRGERVRYRLVPDLAVQEGNDGGGVKYRLLAGTRARRVRPLRAFRQSALRKATSRA